MGRSSSGNWRGKFHLTTAPHAVISLHHCPPTTPGILTDRIGRRVYCRRPDILSLGRRRRRCNRPPRQALSRPFRAGRCSLPAPDALRPFPAGRCALTVSGSVADFLSRQAPCARVSRRVEFRSPFRGASARARCPDGCPSLVLPPEEKSHETSHRIASRDAPPSPGPEASRRKRRLPKPRLEVELREGHCLLDAGFRSLTGFGNNIANSTESRSRFE